MHIAVAVVAFFLFAARRAGEAVDGVAAGPKLGEIEVKAYQKIPKTKVAVQLTSDNHLSRELRRQVMVRLSQRGNEVGFSGGNVMRMDVSYFDLSGGAAAAAADDRRRAPYADRRFLHSPRPFGLLGPGLQAPPPRRRRRPARRRCASR